VVLGVAGGIAAYKAVELLRALSEAGCEVTVVPTANALRFVGEPTWAALSGRPVAVGLWDRPEAVEHVRLGQEADCVIVAPTTADLLARAAHGIADDLLANILLTASCPIVLAPAMHTEMWDHPATAANVALLRGRGLVVIDPAVGRLTGADSGRGRLPEPRALADAVMDLVRRPGADMRGLRVVVTAGGTREPLDPVRFLGNISSGRQGYALARTAAARGAEVALISAHAAIPAPAGVSVATVGTAAQMRDAVLAAAPGADAVVMAAAVADYRPASTSEHKIKKDDAGSGLVLTLEQTEDVLGALVKERIDARQVIVGFAAETGEPGRDVMQLGAEKLARKGCDLLVVNDVSGGRVFGSTENEAVILSADEAPVALPRADKAVIADRIWDAVLARAGRAGRTPLH
jgi:phosphopantothenoylcysteine decarboxylase/phosphopantothenate--cysteine ligase